MALFGYDEVSHLSVAVLQVNGKYRMFDSLKAIFS